MKPGCKLCLLREIDPAEYEAKIKRLIDLMKEDEKTTNSAFLAKLVV